MFGWLEHRFFWEDTWLIEASAMRPDNLVKLDGELFRVIETSLNKMGRGGAIVTAKVKSLKNDSVFEKKFRSNEKVEDIFLAKKDLEYLYQDGEFYVFMDQETYEQYSLSKEQLGDQVNYLTPNIVVAARFYESTPITITLPTSVDMKVEECDPSIKGATAAAQYKPAILETGLKITVPPFISPGDVVTVDTREGKYLSRASSKS